MKFLLCKILSLIDIPVCQGIDGECLKRGYLFRQNTAYLNEDSNWVYVCPDCIKEINSYWDERWLEYNTSRF